MKKSGSNYFALVSSLFLFLLLLVLIPQVDSLQSGFKTVRSANTENILEGLIFMLGTYLAAALTIRIIAIKKVKYLLTLWVQFASGFASKLAPAGIGGFALNTRYLTKQRHSVAEAGAVMGLNGFLGFVGHMLILLVGFLFYRSSFDRVFELDMPTSFIVIVFLSLLLLITASGFLLRNRISHWWADIRKTLKYYRTKPVVILGGFTGAMAVTICFAMALYVSALSLGIHLSVADVLISYTVMSIGVAVTPTPGGIGGAEAALTAILVALGLNTADAFAVALVFRLITFWLPILPGVVVFYVLVAKKKI